MELRAITEQEFRAYSGVLGDAFGWDISDTDAEDWLKTFEFPRSLAAFDGPRLVGTAGAYSYRLTVPGGEVPAAGVSGVAVLPTHRRRGVLTALMRRQLDDVRERGEPVAILWASESIIYGRFGYGVASRSAQLEIARRHARLAGSLEPPGEVELVSKEEAAKLLPECYERIRPSVPGFLNRSPEWWEVLLTDREDWRDGHTANRFAVYRHGDEVSGYTRYRLKSAWEEAVPTGRVRVEELVSAGPEAYQALWGYLFGLDLMETVAAPLRPAEEPLRWMLDDHRRLKVVARDGLWARLVDVAAALQRRRYQAEGRLVLEVTDPMGYAAGRYLLEGGPEGAECGRCDDEPDLILDVAALGACYLGDGDFRSMAAAGRVRGEVAALRRADTMFGWDVPAWCPQMF